MFSESVANLQNIKSRVVQVGNSKVIVQNNPARIRSTAAKIDVKSLAERPCFLCRQNRPPEQQGFEILNGRYVALVNPFPVLPDHFTIVAKDHVKQDIAVAIEDFIALSFILDQKSTLIFNGAKAGASAPDHQHFQIIPSTNLPVLASLPVGMEKHEQFFDAIDFAGSGYLLFYAQKPELLFPALQRALESLKRKSENNLELLNLMSFKTNKGVVVLIAPRLSHRPACYFAEGQAQIMISPAAIELCGVVVLPRQEDFEKISALDLERISKEVCWSREGCEAFLGEAGFI